MVSYTAPVVIATVTVSMSTRRRESRKHTLGIFAGR